MIDISTRRPTRGVFHETSAVMGGMSKRRAGGRPDKGLRDHFAVKPPIDLGEVIRDLADDLDVTYNDLLLSVIAPAFGFPQYAPELPTSRADVQLDLTTTEVATTKAA